MFTHKTLISLSLFFGSCMVSAHTLTILPSHFVQSKTGEWISVDVSATNMTFQADKGVGLDGFKVYLPNGTTTKPATVFQGKRKSHADVELAEAGTYRLELGHGVRYFTSYELKGEKKRLMADKKQRTAELPAGAENIITTRSQSRAMAFVTVNKPSMDVLKVTQQGLEFQLNLHPADIIAGEEVQMLLLMDGKPAANVHIDLSRDGELYRNDAGRVKHITDQSGQFRFVPAEAGRYLIEASYQTKLPSAEADMVRESFTLTFEVGLP